MRMSFALNVCTFCVPHLQIRILLIPIYNQTDQAKESRQIQPQKPKNFCKCSKITKLLVAMKLPLLVAGFINRLYKEISHWQYDISRKTRPPDQCIGQTQTMNVITP